MQTIYTFNIILHYLLTIYKVNAVVDVDIKTDIF
jgi:hypothetical protein